MTRYLSLEDWVTFVFSYLEDLTPEDLLEIDTAAAARALIVASATAGGVDLYDDIHDKAASILLEMLHQGPLGTIAQNREVAVLSAILFLELNDHQWRPAKDELPYWVTEANAGRLSIRTLGKAISQHCQSTPDP